MKAMVLKSYGETAKFEAENIDEPTVSKGHVLVRIAASSVNTVDTMIRQMGQENLPLSPDLPAVLGMDFAGTVEAVGEGVSGFAIGDEVYGCAGGLIGLQGTLTELINADTRLIARKPKTLSMHEAAALPLVGITAFEGLKRAGAAKGQKLLVHGGVGGVGHVAVQLAKHFGADVYSTVRGEDMDVVEQYGATPIDFMTESVEDYVEKHTSGAGFDVIFDSVGGANMANSFEAAALNAQIATTVALLELDLTQAHFKGLSIHVVFMLIPMLHDHGRKTHGDILSQLADIADAGHLKPLLDGSHFELSEVASAYARLTSGKAIGKIIISH